jgi:hypothetical protein
MNAALAIAARIFGPVAGFVLKHWSWFAMAGLVIALQLQGSQLKSVKKDRDQWRATAGAYLDFAHGWEGSYREDKRLRGLEGRQATAALGEAEAACNARVTAARSSAAAIHSIITQEPTYGPDRCPLRQLVDPHRMLDAFGLQAPAH